MPAPSLSPSLSDPSALSQAGGSGEAARSSVGVTRGQLVGRYIDGYGVRIELRADGSYLRGGDAQGNNIAVRGSWERRGDDIIAHIPATGLADARDITVTISSVESEQLRVYSRSHGDAIGSTWRRQR